jgi:hypothetical protein
MAPIAESLRTLNNRYINACDEYFLSSRPSYMEEADAYRILANLIEDRIQPVAFR